MAASKELVNLHIVAAIRAHRDDAASSALSAANLLVPHCVEISTALLPPSAASASPSSSAS